MDTTRTATLLLGTLVTSLSAMAAEPISYPEDYRQWTHVKSMAIHEGHPLATPFLGLHHVYANPAALRGLKNGRYADGASFAFDQLELATADRASTEGPRVLLGVMVKDRTRYPGTGGWGFEAWLGDGRVDGVVKDDGLSCFACHAQRAEQDYVFTEWRD